jgi:hypothetical protein
MEFKDCKTLRNEELKLYKIELENLYEKTKSEIKEKLEFLDILDKEYNKIDSEIKIRGSKLY